MMSVPGTIVRARARRSVHTTVTFGLFARPGVIHYVGVVQERWIGELVLAVTWRPYAPGGRTGQTAVSYGDGEGDRGDMTLVDAERLAQDYFGAHKVQLPLSGGGVEWVRGTRRAGVERHRGSD